jgi:hypothetical protein
MPPLTHARLCASAATRTVRRVTDRRARGYPASSCGAAGTQSPFASYTPAGADPPRRGQPRKGSRSVNAGFSIK